MTTRKETDAEREARRTDELARALHRAVWIKDAQQNYTDMHRRRMEALDTAARATADEIKSLRTILGRDT